ncbi:carbohydrate ABC transporter permease [Natronobiforma cellulositropha]|uniref:carbohydrate ABC transporter permease n=1 Tax=Natronobiforma cellulositropha TaxID=1679076 RepID=UPI0021D5E0CB|nr:sugar ABC transporter permease [Natronobiforma cellulositropha]
MSRGFHEYKDRIGGALPATPFSAEKHPDNLAGFLFILPNLVVFSAFLFGPVIYAFYLSFTEWSIIAGEATWIGLENYRDLLYPLPWANDWAVLDRPTENLWWYAVINTLTFVIGTVPLGIFGGLTVALVLDKRIRFRKFYRTTFFMPVMLSGAVSAVIWRWILSVDGIVNSLLAPVGLDHAWAGDPATALFAVIMIAVWGGIGFNMIIFLAGLQNIPEELYEAARIDGTSQWQQFRHVTWPNLQNTYFFVIVLAIINSFQVFGIAQAFAEGGPYYSTTVIVVRIYQEAFQNGNLGYASAMAFILFVFVFAFSYYQYRIRGQGEVTY